MTDTVTYSIQAPNGLTYEIDGPKGATQEQVQAEVLKQHPDAIKSPSEMKQNISKERLRGNIINTDVPTVVGEVPNPPAIENPKRQFTDYLKALYEVPATAVSGAVSQPAGAAYGVYKGITSPQYGTQAGVEEGRQAGAELVQKLQYQPTSPVTQDVLGAVGNAMDVAKVPVTPGGIGQIPSFAQQTRNVAQFVKPLAGNVIQTAKNEAPTVSKLAQALRSEPKVDYKSIAKSAPSAETLAQESSALFNAAKQSGVELNAKDFATNMASVTKDLRNEGYDPRLYPKLAVAVEELTNAQIPKDFNELSTLRKFIRNAQKSADPDERRLATTLKEDFDAYVSTIPESSVVGGSKQGLADWKQARDSYAKLSKSEIFTDMLEKAELDRSKFTQSGAENAMASQLRKLAKNDKQMRLFTAEEQEAIKQAAKGGTMQNLLKFYGRFSPTGPVSGIFAGGAMLAHPAVAIPLELGAVAARAGATKMRKDSINQLAALMRAGIKGKENE